MATQAERLYITLEARLDRYTRDLNQAQATTNARLGAIENRFARFSSTVQGSTLGVGAALGGLGGALGTAAVLEYANEWTRLVRSLSGSEQAFGIALTGAHDLVKLSNEARIDVAEFSKTYVRTAAAVRDYGYTSNDAAKVTSTLAKALKLGQASAGEQASTILQFSQALQKGKLDGDEFRTVMENAGIVQEILAKKLKVSKGEIIEMAQAGKLNIKTLVSAMLESNAEIDKLFKEMPLTVDEAFSVLKNNVIEYIGTADQANGVTRTLADGIVGIANHLDAVAVVAGAILGSASLRMTAFAAATVSAANPVTLLAAAIGALTVAYETMGKNVAISEDGVVKLGDAVSVFFDKLNATSELEALTLQIELLTGAEREAAIEHKKLVEKYAGFTGAWRLAGDAVLYYASALDDLAGGPIKRVIAGAEAMGASIAKATGLMDDARNMALARQAAEVSFGYGGGLKGALQDRARNPRDVPQKVVTTAFSREVDQIKKRTEALKAEVETLGQGTFAQERAKAAAELRAAAAATAAKEHRKVTAEELASIEKLADAYGAAQAQAAFLGKLQSERDRTRDLRDQIDLIGLEGKALEKARIEQALLNDARRAGITLTAAQKDEIAALAERNAALQHTIDIISEVRDTSRDAIKGFISDMREGKSATEALGNALNKMADKLIDMAVNSLVENALGSLLKGTSGASGGGGVFASLFGFANGGVMVPGQGPASLPRFARGGVSTSAAIFGEAGPEAAVPLPDGRRIPVDLRMPSVPRAVAPAVSNNFSLQLSIDARGATADGAAALKADIVPTIQKVVRREVNELFDRSARYAKTGI